MHKMKPGQRLKTMSSNAMALALAAVLSTAAGCSDSTTPTYPVRGKIVFTTGAVPIGSRVQFESLSHRASAFGDVQTDGSYALTSFEGRPGAAAGEYRVAIFPPDPPGNVHESEFRPTGPPIPKRYRAFETSEIKVKVEAQDQNEFNITLGVR